MVCAIHFGSVMGLDGDDSARVIAKEPNVVVRLVDEEMVLHEVHSPSSHPPLGRGRVAHVVIRFVG